MGQLHSIRYRRDTAANWASVNPVLQEGEPGYETDTGIVKIGDGATAYNSLGAIFHSEIEALENDINYATTIKQKAVTEEGGVFNGDFEYGVGSLSASDDFIGDKKYGWWLNTTGNAIASFDSVVSYNGGQSLKIELTDASATGIVSRNKATALIFPVKPSTKYRLSARIKTENAATDSVWFTSTQYDSDGAIIAGTWTAGTSAKLSGDNDWTYVEKIITTDASAVEIDPQFYHGVAGNIATAWFDDIKLEQIDTQTVNTQVATPASVSVEGVTTTDNVDQSLETSGQTYTLTTGIDEGATHRQSFTPTADRGDGKHILSKIQALVATVGTGDWTLTVHDASNNILASQTIANGSMSTGDVDFDVPALLDVGTEYHFHITSTVADGTVTTTTLNDLETVDYHAQFAKHTESPIIEANGAKLDLTGTEMLTGATITVNKDGSGKYEWYRPFSAGDAEIKMHDIYDYTPSGTTKLYTDGTLRTDLANDYFEYKIVSPFPLSSAEIPVKFISGASSNSIYFEYSIDGNNWIELGELAEASGTLEERYVVDGMNTNVIFLRCRIGSGSVAMFLKYIGMIGTFTHDVQLPLMIPSAEVQSETSDLTQNPIDISEGQFWQLKNDLTGWGSRNIVHSISEQGWLDHPVPAGEISIYDSNGTDAWTWDDRNGLVPPADRTSGVVMAKFLVGDNQIKTQVNDGSMKANFNLAWDEESLRAAINRLTDLVNMQYPIVVEVEDVPAIDVENEPTGCSAETGYTNDVTSLRQTTAGVAAIAYTGLLPREDRFSEWLDVIVECDDGDGTLQGKLYTESGTLIATYADIMANPVMSISDPDYKYSRERLVLQISASSETTSTAWSVSKITWRYQYNG